MCPSGCLYCLAALTALPAVLNHKQGVEHTAHRLIQHWQEQLQQRQAQAASAPHRGRGPAATVTGTGNKGLLSLSCVNRFLSSAVSVARSLAAGDVDAAEQAAVAALQVANTLFAKQLVAVLLAAAAAAVRVAGSSSTAAHGHPGAAVAASAAGAEVCPDAATYGCLLRLYGMTGQHQQVADVTMAAVTQQLGIGSSSSCTLQERLACSAAAHWVGNGVWVLLVLCLHCLTGLLLPECPAAHINLPALIDRLLWAALLDTNA